MRDDRNDWRAVQRLCHEIQAELDGDKPIHSTDMQNALAEVWSILLPDEGYPRHSGENAEGEG